MWVTMKICLPAQIYFGSPHDCPFVDQAVKHHLIGDKVLTLLAVCETETLTHATFIHGYFISSLILTSIMLYIISFIIFSVHHQLSVGQVAISLQYLAAEMERMWQEQVNRKKVGPLAKGTKRKRTAGLCREYIRKRLEVCRRGKGESLEQDRKIIC